MRIHTIYFAVVMLFAVLAPSAAFSQAASATHPEISVRLSRSKRTFRIGEPIHLGIQVSNRGGEPILIANSVSISSGGTSFLNLELKDARGRISPATQLIVDYAPRPPDENAFLKLLSSWVLLKPNTSILFQVSIDSRMFQFLSKPGEYTLSATYSSNGISYAGYFGSDVLNSLPYTSWSGKISANEIPLTIVPASKMKK
jgi:hypothetical protein